MPLLENRIPHRTNEWRRCRPVCAPEPGLACRFRPSGLVFDAAVTRRID